MPQPKSGQAAKPAEPPKPRTVRIDRQTVAAWWCPVCGHSNTQLTPSCGGCGADRDGDAVTPKAEAA